MCTVEGVCRSTKSLFGSLVAETEFAHETATKLRQTQVKRSFSKPPTWHGVELLPICEARLLRDGFAGLLLNAKGLMAVSARFEECENPAAARCPSENESQSPLEAPTGPIKRHQKPLTTQLST